MSTSTIHVGDCRDVLATLPDASIDSIVTDPPYELGFMGKAWDATGIANNVDMWRECLRVLKPGGHLLAFSGSRTYHRMACAIEDAGFEIRDQIMWVYGSGFPKSLDVSKAIDKAAGAERERIPKRGIASGQGKYGGGASTMDVRLAQVAAPATDDASRWHGWGTALKPAHEPIVLARKPLVGTVAANVLQHGTGALNIDDCRIGRDSGDISRGGYGNGGIGIAVTGSSNGEGKNAEWVESTHGRWPANFIHDGSDEVTDLMGEAARFFYCAKASKTDRNEGLDGFETIRASSMGYDKGLGNAGEGMFKDRNPQKQNHHPTVKPTDLMRYLCRLITPPNGVVLDPFTGSGSTGKAAMLERFSFIGIEQDPDYTAIAEARIKHALNSREETLFDD